MASTTFSGPVTSTAGFISGPDSLVVAGFNTIITPEKHAGRTLVMTRADGHNAELPPATGSGHCYRIFLATTITSNTTVITVGSGADVMAGVAIVANDGGASASIFETAADSDTITFDGSTTGGIRGATVELQDVAAGLWSVRIVGAATGSEATPFSDSVS
jgi:hypothetical protein